MGTGILIFTWKQTTATITNVQLVNIVLFAHILGPCNNET